MTAFLLGFGLILIILNTIAIKKEKSSFKYTLDNTEKDMKDFQVEIGALRKEIGESILDLQKEIEEIKSSLETYKKSKINNLDGEKIAEYIIGSSNIEKHEENIGIIEENVKIEEESSKLDEENKAIQNGNSVKIEQIGNMLNSGMSIEEISEQLNVSKGEVLLIKELYLK